MRSVAYASTKKTAFASKPRVELGKDLTAIVRAVSDVDDDRHARREVVEQIVAFDAQDVGVPAFEWLDELVGNSAESHNSDELFRVGLAVRRQYRGIESLGLPVVVGVEPRAALSPEQPLRDHLTLQLDRRESLQLGAGVNRLRRREIDVEPD